MDVIDKMGCHPYVGVNVRAAPRARMRRAGVQRASARNAAAQTDARRAPSAAS